MSTGDSEDEVLEKMLVQAHRLSLRMRSSISLDVSNRSEPDQDRQDVVQSNILSFDSDSHADPETQISLQAHFDRINQQATTPESKESHSSGCDEKSYVSIVSAQQEAIDSAVKAALEMELTLKALKPQSDSPDRLSSPSQAKSLTRNASNKLADYSRQLNGSPNRSRDDEELNNSSNSVSWEKVNPITEGDEDYVPIVDYSSPKKKPLPRNDSDIKWEKISSPQKHEDDYVPVADYSRPPCQSPLQRIRVAILPTKNRINGSSQLPRRNSRRKRRRKLLLMTAGPVLVALLAFYFFLNNDASKSPEQVELCETPQEEMEQPVIDATSDNVAEPSSVDDELQDSEPFAAEMSLQEFEEVLFPFSESDVLSDPGNDEDDDSFQPDLDIAPFLLKDDECGVKLAQIEEMLEPPEKEPPEEPLEPPDLGPGGDDCGGERRCSRDQKRKLFTRENIEELLATMMQ